MLPMLIVSIVTYLLAELSGGLIEKFVTDILLYGDAIAGLDPILYMLGAYPLDVAVLILTGIITLFVTVIAFVSVSKFCDGKGFVESINSSVMEWKRNLGLVIFGAIIVFLFFAIWNGALFVIDFIDTLLGGALGPLIYYLIIPIVTIILIVIFAIKLSFVLPAFAQGDKVKESIQKSWEVTNDSFWNALVFVVIVLVISFIISQIFLYLSLNILEIEIILLSIGEIISMTFIALGISNYYYQR